MSSIGRRSIKILLFEYGTDSFVSAQAFLANILLLQGFPDQAGQLCTEAFEVARRASHIHTLEYALFFGPIRRHFGLRKLSSFQQNVAELAAVAREHNLPMWQAYAATQQGWYLSQTGQFDAAIAMLLDGLAGLKASGVSYDTPLANGQLAEAYLKAGRHSQGLDAIEKALTAVQSTNERWFEPEIYRLQGELLAKSDANNVAAAKAAFENSLELARALDAKWWELRTAMSLAQNQTILGGKCDGDASRHL